MPRMAHFHENPNVLDWLLTFLHKVSLINVNSLTSLSHVLVDPSLSPLLIFLHWEVSEATCYISMMFITSDIISDALWSASISFHSVNFPFSYPVISQIHPRTITQPTAALTHALFTHLPLAKSPEASTNQCQAAMPTCQFQLLCG